MSLRVLTLNSGSSSLKFSVYEMGEREIPILRGIVSRIGLSSGRFSLHQGDSAVDRAVNVPDHEAALRLLFDDLRARPEATPINAIGHRVVQGGPRHTAPQPITPAFLDELRKLIPLDPLHLPVSLAAIEAATKIGVVEQVACFDTAFHRTLPPVAQAVPIPHEWAEADEVVRYGFHGLSYEFIVGELARIAGNQAASGKVVIAHLGNGASMAAVREGRSVETTMGFSSAGGLVMSTRPGEIDPGVLAFLVRRGRCVSSDDFDALLYRRGGLAGISGVSGDLLDLHRAAGDDPRAALALDLFCHSARKHLGALTAVLDGLETLVFTAGIGEHDAEVRSRICRGFGHLGLVLDEDANRVHAPLISHPSSRVAVRVIPTNEELVIARHTARLCRNPHPVP